MKRILLSLFLVMVSAPAFAQTSIWGATDREGTTTEMRFPVDTGSSSSPGYLSITPSLSGVLFNSGGNLVTKNAADTRTDIAAAPSELTIIDETADDIWALTDSGDYIRYNSSGSLAATIPPNGDVAFSVGTQIPFSMRGGGTLTVGPGSGVTITAIGGGLTFSSAGGYAVKTGTNAWDVIGGQ